MSAKRSWKPRALSEIKQWAGARSRSTQNGASLPRHARASCRLVDYPYEVPLKGGSSFRTLAVSGRSVRTCRTGNAMGRLEH